MQRQFWASLRSSDQNHSEDFLKPIPEVIRLTRSRSVNRPRDLFAQHVKAKRGETTILQTDPGSAAVAAVTVVKLSVPHINSRGKNQNFSYHLFLLLAGAAADLVALKAALWSAPRDQAHRFYKPGCAASRAPGKRLRLCPETEMRSNPRFRTAGLRRAAR